MKYIDFSREVIILSVPYLRGLLAQLGRADDS